MSKAINSALSQSLALFAADPREPEEFASIRAGRAWVKVRAKNAAAIAKRIKTAHLTYPRGRNDRAKTPRNFPKFTPGMSTREYVTQFIASNQGAAWGAHPLPFDLATLNGAPCTLYEGGAPDFDVIEETDTPATTADTAAAALAVADVIAHAEACAAIEQASTSAALGEISEPATVARADIEQPAAALAMADAGGSTGAAPGAGHASSNHTTSAPARQGQAIASKSGKWSARFYPGADGAPCMEFTFSGMPPTVQSFDNGRDRMRALQQAARLADETARAITPADLRDFDVMHASVKDVQDLSDADYSALVDHLEDINFHAENVVLSALRAGLEDAASEARDMVRRILQAGGASWEDIEQRRALMARIHAAQPTTAENPCETSDPVDDESRETSPEFRKVEPLSMDLRAAIAAGMPIAALVGMGVDYSGDRANPSAEGAIVSAEPCRWAGVRVSIQYEDGRATIAKGAEFGDKIGDRLRLNWKLHGAPYLAQLAAAVASRKAATTSAEDLAKQTHAAELVRLAAEFPTLQRAGDSKAVGGKLAAVNIRTLLKGAFKGTKFSVTSDYSSVRVAWTDGPSVEHVNAIIDKFDIGASDPQTDYFYTVRTAFSELFGGVQYLNTCRELSDTTISAALIEIYGTDAAPSVEDYRNGRPWATLPAPVLQRHGTHSDPYYWIAQVRRAADKISL